MVSVAAVSLANVCVKQDLLCANCAKSSRIIVAVNLDMVFLKTEFVDQKDAEFFEKLHECWFIARYAVVEVSFWCRQAVPSPWLNINCHLQRGISDLRKLFKGVK